MNPSASPWNLSEYRDLIALLETKVGRVIFNGFGTGLEVCPSLHHGGPYPATTDAHFTSIGHAGIFRFARPAAPTVPPRDRGVKIALGSQYA